MKKLLHILLLMIVPLAAIASEGEKGTLSVLLFSDGKPLVKNEVKIDGKHSYKTDRDGAVKVSLPAGRHQLEIFGKSASGQNLGYFKKPIQIKEGRNTEVIATLSKKGADSIDIDTPVAVAASEKRKEETVTGEGKLVGRILSSEGNTPIAGARIFVRGTSVDVRSDEKGRFSAVVPSGKTLSISVVHSAYSAQTIGGIVVKKDGVLSRTVKLTPASMELEEFVVLAPKIEGSLADVLQEEKNTNSIANIIGAEAFSKKGDSSAASALKRASGITLIGGNVYVRGLGDRYSNIEMNSMPLPSPDPLRRLVPLDTFPSSVIGSMKIQKSGEADIPAAFGGGYINIRTKQSVAEDFLKATLSVGANRDTGSKVITQNGSSEDWTGYDDGYWSRPPLSLSPSDFTQAYFLRDYSTPYKTLPLNFGMKMEGGKNIEINDEHKISVFASYKYEQKHEADLLEQFTQDMKQDFLGFIPGTLIPMYSDYYLKKLTKTVTESSSSTYAHGGIFDIGYNFQDVFKVNYTKLYTHKGEKSTSLRTREDLSGSNPTDYTYTLRWIEKTLDVDQLNGKFDYEVFDLASKFHFGMQHATSLFDRPNDLEYIFEECPQHLLGTPQCPTGKYLPTGVANLNVRTERSEDQIDAYYLRNKVDLPVVSSEDYLELGFSRSDKKRDFSSTPGRFIERGEVSEFQTDSNGYFIGDISTLIEEHGEALTFQETPLNNGANIKASVAYQSSYAKVFLKPYENIEMIAGVRHADITQETNTIDPNDASKNTSNEVVLNDYFPSFSLRYMYDEKNHFDFAVSETYIMPDLIEFADAIIVAPTEKRIDIKGNPELEPTTLKTFDIKYSYYFNESEYFKIGSFYKEMKNPIEDAEVKSASDGVSVYTFMNSDKAEVYGVELDGRKGLGFLHRYLSDFYISGNYTYLSSEVTLTEEQALRFTTNNRELQGLSPHIVNLALEYESDERTITLAYNKMWERIRQIGYKDEPSTDVLKGIPDTYEIPPSILDLVWNEKFSNGLSFKLKLGNLLDEETVWYKYGGSLLKGEGKSQEYARENFITDRYKEGREIKLSVTYEY